MTFPRKTAYDGGLRFSRRGRDYPPLTRPASARRRRNDASDTASLMAAWRGSPRPSRETGLSYFFPFNAFINASVKSFDAMCV